MDIQLPNGTVLANVPEGTSQADIIAKLGSDHPALQFTNVPRETNGLAIPAQIGQGANDSLVSTAAALPELAAAGMRKIPGIGPYIAPPSGTYQNAIEHGLENIGLRKQIPAPQTDAEKFAYGAGHGAVDAASTFVPAAALANGAKAGSMAQNLGKLLADQPVMQGVSGALGEGTTQSTGSPLAGIGAAMATPLGAATLTKSISPAISQLSPEAQRLASLLKNEGVSLTAGQETGSKPVQIAESVLDNLPFSSSMAAGQKAGQRQAFNAAVLDRAGINASTATPDVLDQAFNKLGSQFDQISGKTTVNLDDKFMTDLQTATDKYGTKLPTNVKPVFNSYIDDLTSSGDQMPGTVYQQARSDLTRQAKSLTNSDPTLSNALRGVRDALDNAANRSIPPDLQQAWQDTRSQYANLKTISNAMAGQGAMQAQGDISPSALYNAARGAVSKDQFTRGAGDLNDLARAGQLFLKPSVPNSGTAQRQFFQNALTGGNMAAGFAAGGPMGAAGALAIPPLAHALMQSGPGRAYLTNQLMSGITPRITPQLLAAQLTAQDRTPALQYLEGQQ